MNDQRVVIQDLKDFAEAVEALAFKMPAPNDWTPQFVQLAQAAKRLAAQAEACRRAHHQHMMRNL